MNLKHLNTGCWTILRSDLFYLEQNFLLTSQFIMLFVKSLKTKIMKRRFLLTEPLSKALSCPCRSKPRVIKTEKQEKVSNICRLVKFSSSLRRLIREIRRLKTFHHEGLTTCWGWSSWDIKSTRRSSSSSWSGWCDGKVQCCSPAQGERVDRKSMSLHFRGHGFAECPF